MLVIWLVIYKAVLQGPSMIKNIKMVVERVHILLVRLNYKLSDLLSLS